MTHAIGTHHPGHTMDRVSNWNRDTTAENRKVGKQATASNALATCELQETWLCNNCQDLKLTRASAEEFGTTESLYLSGENAGQCGHFGRQFLTKLKVLLI